MILFSPGALEDLERVFTFHLDVDADVPAGHLASIRRAVLILEEHPHIGRPVPGSELKALIISVGKTGSVALYQYDALDEVVRVLSVRHQREAGFRGP